MLPSRRVPVLALALLAASGASGCLDGEPWWAADPRAPFLLVQEWDWANATGDARILAHFGPHCAPVRYDLDGPSVTRVTYGDQAQGVLLNAVSGVVVRDWNAGPLPDRAVTTSADRLGAHFIEGAARAVLASPFDDDVTLAEVEVDGEDFVVDGRRLAPGDSTTLRHAGNVTFEGETFETVNILRFTHAGEARLEDEPSRGACD